MHQSLRDPLGNNLRNKKIQNIEVVSIIWTSMNVDVTSLSDSRMRKINYLALLNFKQQSENGGLLVWYNNLHLVPQLKSLHRKIGRRAYLFGTPCITNITVYCKTIYIK